MKNRLSIFVVLLIAILTANLGSFQTSVQAQTLTVSQQEGYGSSQGFGRNWEQSYEPQRGVRAIKTFQDINLGLPADQVTLEVEQARIEFENILTSLGANFRLLENNTSHVLEVKKFLPSTDLKPQLQYEVKGLSARTIARLISQSKIKVFSASDNLNVDEFQHRVRNLVTDDRIEPAADSDLQNLPIAPSVRDQSGKRIIGIFLDQGLDLDFFKDRLTFNKNESGNPNEDRDGNGVPGDVFYAYNAVVEDGPPNALNINALHGNAMTSMFINTFEQIALSENSNAKLTVVPIRVIGNVPGTDQQLINGLLYATAVVRDNPDALFVLNMSISDYGYNSIVDLLLAKLATNNVLINAAAGNRFGSGGVDLLQNKIFPAHYAKHFPSITVGAVDDSGALSSFSNYGSIVRLFARGVNVETGFGRATGTSIATPQVAAVGAFLMVQQGLNVWQVIQALTYSSDQLSSLTGRVHPKGGVLNIQKALRREYSNPILTSAILVADKVKPGKIKGHTDTLFPVRVPGVDIEVQPKNGGFAVKIPQGSSLRTSSFVIVASAEGGAVVSFQR